MLSIFSQLFCLQNKNYNETKLDDPDAEKEAAEKEENLQKLEGKTEDMLVERYKDEGTEQERESEALMY